MKRPGWLVEEAMSVPPQPMAWFAREVEARVYAAENKGVVREMTAAVQPDPHAPQRAEASL